MLGRNPTLQSQTPKYAKTTRFLSKKEETSSSFMCCFSVKKSTTPRGTQIQSHNKIVKKKPIRVSHPIVRNFKAMFVIADHFNLKQLAKFSMICRSFYWIAGRK